MILWLDAQLSPAIATWISREFSISAVAVRDLGLRNAKDRHIFLAAREANAVSIWSNNPVLLHKSFFLHAGTPPTPS